MEVKEELSALFPRLSGAARENLKQSISEEGIREPVVVWSKTGWLLDGHNRYDIAQELGIDVPVNRIEIATLDHLDDLEIAELWMRRNQAGRRNLSPNELSFNRGRQYELSKKAEGGQGGNRNASKDDGAKTAPSFGRTREHVAKDHDVSPRTVANDAAYVRAIESLRDNLSLERKDTMATLSKSDAKKLAKLSEQDRDRAAALWPRMRKGDNFRKASGDLEREIAMAKAEALKLEAVGRIEAVEQADAVDFLGTLSDVDCFVFDPPYGIDTHRTRKGGHDYADGESYAKKLLGRIALAVRQCAKPGAHVYCFAGYSHVAAFKRILATHLEVQDNPLVWVKNNHTMRDFSTGYANKHEYIIFAKVPGGERKLQAKCSTDVLAYSRQSDTTHSAEKPISLLEYLIQNSTLPGELVVDPFLGGGSTGVAAVQCQRRFAGCDIDPEWAAFSKTRIVEACNA